MRVALYEPRGGGHRPAFVRGLAAVAIELGHEPVIIGARVDGVAEGVLQPPFSYSNSFVYQRQVKPLYRLLADHQIDVFVDLTFDNSVWGLSPVLGRVVPRRVHVLHKTRVFQTRGRSLQGKLMARYLRLRARRLVSSGVHLVVHSEATKRYLGQFLDPDRMVHLAFPTSAVSPAVDQPTTRPLDSRPLLLYVGSERADKGLEAFLRSFEETDIDVRVQVVGKQPARIVELVGARNDQRISLIGHNVEAAVVAEMYAACSAVVVPYPPAFRTGGGVSGVLLDALAHGKPVIVTPPVAELLPAGYRGMVVATDDSPQALAVAVETAVRLLPELSRRAAAAGPEYIEREHKFTDYLSAILNCVS